MLKGAHCHRESRKPGQLQTHTLSVPPTHCRSHKPACYNAHTPAPRAKAHVTNEHRHTQSGPHARLHAALTQVLFPNLHRPSQITTKRAWMACKMKYDPVTWTRPN